MKRCFFYICGMLYAACLHAQTLTLDECQKLAQENYPLIQQYELVKKSTDYSVSNARKAYLPQFALSLQATYQSDVPGFPDSFQKIFSQSGINLTGINKDQYKATLEVNQSIWDGGNSRVRKQIAEAGGEVDRKEVEVEMYAIRKQVNELYFGLLQLDDQIAIQQLTQSLLQSNYEKVKSYLANGVAMQSDLDAVKAEMLQVKQSIIQLESTKVAYRQMLSIFIGRSVSDKDQLSKPSRQETGDPEIFRPELQWFASQRSLLEKQEKQIAASLRPQLGLFAQGYYGNPGLNFMHSMMVDEWSWDYMVGVRLQWNFGGLYTRKNDLQKLKIARQQVDNRQQVFLFNTSLQTAQEQNNILRLEKVLNEDEEIIALKQSVRKAAESKYANGVIDISSLLRDITAENQAMTAKSSHEIDLLKEIYEWKYITNN